MVTSTLLKKSEQTTCEKIAASTTGLEGKRAAALLALNTGATQTDAAAGAGLTLGQVRYLLTLFRDKGMALFTTTAAPKATARPATAKAKSPAKTSTTKKPKDAKSDKKKDKKEKGKKKKDKGAKKKDKKSKKKK